MKFVPEVTASGKSYAKFIDWNMNSVSALAHAFNRDRAEKGPSLNVYRRIVQQV